MSPVLLHTLHAAVLAVPASIVAAVILRGHRTARSAAALREVIARGDLLALAEERARRTLAARPPRPGVRVFAVASAVSGVVHGAVCPEHFEEGLRFGLFFLALSATQFAVAIAAALGRHTAASLALGAVTGAAAIALWVLTRTVGLPFGLAEIEPIGLWDSLASVAEAVACAAAIVALRGAPVRSAAPAVGA